MARIPYVDLTKASPKVRETLAKLEPLNIFRMVAHADSCFGGFIRLGSALLTRSELPPELREIAILRVAAACGAFYEWTHHTAMAARCGLSEAKIEAIGKTGEESGTIPFTETERLVLRFTDELLAAARVSDAIFTLVQKHLPPRQLVELILTVGYYMMVARLLETTGVDLEPGVLSGMVPR